MSIISESGLYNAIFKSRREEAHRFRKWVTAEVLPELRRTGRYQLRDQVETEREEDFDPVRLNAHVAAVRLGLRLWGPKAARNMWVDLGLPLRIADARTGYKDAMAGPLKEWLDLNDPSTTAEITSAMGLDPTATGERKRVTTLLGIMGWWSKRHRRGSDLVWAWFPPEGLRGEADHG